MGAFETIGWRRERDNNALKWGQKVGKRHKAVGAEVGWLSYVAKPKSSVAEKQGPIPSSPFREFEVVCTQ